MPQYPLLKNELIRDPSLQEGKLSFCLNFFPRKRLGTVHHSQGRHISIHLDSNAELYGNVLYWLGK